MKTIWKFPLETIDDQIVEMPYGAQILSAHLQKGVITLWAMVEDTETEKEKRIIHIRGTGHSLEGLKRDKFIGTVLIYEALVFHVFEG